MSHYPREPRREAGSEIQLLVDRDAVLTAVSLVMIDEPPHIQRLGKIAVLVIELDGPLEPSEEFHALRIIGHQGMREPRGLVDEVPRMGHPVVLEVPDAPL